MITFILILSIASTLGVAYLLWSRKGAPDISGLLQSSLEDWRTQNEKSLKEEMAANRKEAADSQKRLREELIGLFKGFGEPVERRMIDFATAQTKNFDNFSI